jgi:hypothetical protein
MRIIANMLIDIAQTLLQSPIDATHLTTLPHADLFHFDLLQTFHIPHDSDFLAQINNKIPETDLGGDVSKMWKKFVSTGQVWAFLVGTIFGYLVKTFTSYG